MISSSRSIWWIAGIIASIPAAGMIFFLAIMLLPGLANSAAHSNPWLLTWIPATCCVTNDCCWQISARELRPLPDDAYEIRSTGQVIRRTAWSPDGLYYRCACDRDDASKRWVRHQGAHTRCLFVPLQFTGRMP